jgi:hypothetical protein
MGRIFSILYFIFYLILATVAIAVNISHRYPHWFTALEILFRGGAVVCILFYIIRFRPKDLVFLWKMVPVSLVMFDMFSLFYGGFDSGLNFSDFTTFAIISVLCHCPSWYLCFRFGYLKEIVDYSESKVKIGIFELSIIVVVVIFCFLFVVLPIIFSSSSFS